MIFKPDYNQLMEMRNSFVVVCVSRGHDPKAADEYFTQRAIQEGWIHKVDETV